MMIPIPARPRIRRRKRSSACPGEFGFVPRVPNVGLKRRGLFIPMGMVIVTVGVLLLLLILVFVMGL